MDESKAPSSTAPRLTRRADFEAALKNYHLSPEGNSVLQETPLIAMVGPTSAGRNTVIRELLKNGHYYFVVSDTTRPPRQNDGVWEKEGVEYFFRTEADMLADIQAGLFAEAEIIHKQQVSGQSIREIRKARDQGKIAITDVEILGGINTARLKPDAKVIYLVPPSFEEWLRRIHGRTKVSEKELRNRLEGAMKGFRLALEHEFFVFVINKNKDETAVVIDGIARENKRDPAAEQEGRELVRQLLKRTEEYLQNL